MEKISILDASKMSSFSVSSIRKWIHEGVIDGEKTLKKKKEVWVVDKKSLLNFLSKNKKNEVIDFKTNNDSFLDSLKTQLEYAQKELIKKQSTIDYLMHQNDELQKENRKLNAELRALLEGKNDGVLMKWVKTFVKIHDPNLTQDSP